MGRKAIIYIVVMTMSLGLACSDKSTEPEDPLGRFLGGVSFGADTAITNMTKPLVVSFITLMDRESVQNAFSCEPQFEYNPHWTVETHFNPVDPDVATDHHQFYLFPDLPFTPNTTFKCRIDTTAKDALGNSLPIPFEFQFTTSPGMVTGITPVYDGVDPNDYFPMAIRLSFNTAIDLSTIQTPLTSDPVLEYELYGISRQKHLFEYRIKTPLRAESEYEIGISGQIFDAWGNPINTDTVMTFNTGTVDVIYYFPNPNFNLKSKRPIIQVRFNTVMDRPSTEAAFTFGAGPGAMTGTFYWFSDKGFQYFLDQDLLKDQEYTIRVRTSASDTYGTLLSQPFSYTFVF